MGVMYFAKFNVTNRTKSATEVQGKRERERERERERDGRTRRKSLEDIPTQPDQGCRSSQLGTRLQHCTVHLLVVEDAN
jgi:hypothetical protein